MKYKHNANIKLKTGRNRSHTTIESDENKVETDIAIGDQRP